MNANLPTLNELFSGTFPLQHTQKLQNMSQLATTALKVTVVAVAAFFIILALAPPLLGMILAAPTLYICYESFMAAHNFQKIVNSPHLRNAFCNAIQNNDYQRFGELIGSYAPGTKFIAMKWVEDRNAQALLSEVFVG